MKSIGEYKEAKILKLFLGGFSYDEIAQQVGLSHGSVANTVDKFRNGELPIPLGMTEYVDELRHLVVDMKKEHTTPAEVKSCLNIHQKLLKMGVDTAQAEQWLDISQDIASPAGSDNLFVQAAVELTQLAAESGLGYKALVDDYHAKLNHSKALDIEIEGKSKKSEVFDLNYEKKKKEAAKEVESTNKAIAAAQDNFAAEKKKMQSQLEEFMAQHNLTSKKVKLANVLLDEELKKAGVSAQGKEQFCTKIMAAESLAAGIKLLDEEQAALKAQVKSLKQEKQSYTYSIDQLKIMNDSLFKAQAQKGQEVLELEKSIASSKKEAEKWAKVHLDVENDVRVTCLIIRFLLNPDKMASSELDQLVSLMLAIRQQRQGIWPREARDATGNMCKCQVPPTFYGVAMGGEALDQARKMLAMCLMPVVKDHFVTKFDYQLAELDSMRNRNEAAIRAIGQK